MSGEARFDPLGDLTTAQFAKPAELKSVNLRVLTPFQRCLIVIDGTVTKFLEAYTLEPIRIRQVSQTVSPLQAAHRWLEAPQGTSVASRQVLIEAAYSQTLYVHAVSLVVLERLPETARERLEIPGEGLGRVLNEHNIESRRELLWFGKERVGELIAAVPDSASGEFISRTYRIIVEGRPIAMITERFPSDIEDSLTHH